MSSIQSIELPKQLISSLWHKTRKAYPREACALLYGHLSGPHAIVRKIRTVNNLNKGLNGFAIEKKEILQARNNTTDKLLGLFHSHRQETNPSAADMRSMKKQRLVWLIASSGHPPRGSAFSLKAYAYKGGIISELKIKEVNP